MQSLMDFIRVAKKAFPKVKDSNAVFCIYSKSRFIIMKGVHALCTRMVSDQGGLIWPLPAHSSFLAC